MKAYLCGSKDVDIELNGCEKILSKSSFGFDIGPVEGILCMRILTGDQLTYV